MRVQDVVKQYGTLGAAAAALGISRPAVSKWREIVPYASAKRLEEITSGALRVDDSLYDQHLRPLRSGSRH